MYLFHNSTNTSTPQLYNGFCSAGPTAASAEWDEAGLRGFLSSINVGSSIIQEVADKLNEEGYTSEAALLAATDEDLAVLHLKNSAFRLILQWCEKKRIDPLVDIQLKYKRDAAKIQMLKSTVSVDTLSAAVKSQWKEFEVAAFEFSVNAVTLSKENEFHLLRKFPLQVAVENLSKGFSKFREKDAYAYARVSSAITDTKKFPQTVQVDKAGKWFQHALDDLKIKHELFGALTEGCEYTRREFISAVLILSAKLAGVKLAVEERIEGSLGNGPVDWVALYQSYRVCVTEGKKDALSDGLIQNIGQLAATREDRNPKRNFSPTIPSYGITTTYTEWVFLKLTDGPRELFRWTDDSIIITQTDLGGSLQEVVGRIVGIFQQQQKEINDQMSARGGHKRRRR